MGKKNKTKYVPFTAKAATDLEEKKQNQLPEKSQKSAENRSLEGRSKNVQSTDLHTGGIHKKSNKTIHVPLNVSTSTKPLNYSNIVKSQTSSQNSSMVKPFGNAPPAHKKVTQRDDNAPTDLESLNVRRSSTLNPNATEFTFNANLVSLPTPNHQPSRSSLAVTSKATTEFPVTSVEKTDKQLNSGNVDSDTDQAWDNCWTEQYKEKNTRQKVERFVGSSEHNEPKSKQRGNADSNKGRDPRMERETDSNWRRNRDNQRSEKWEKELKEWERSWRNIKDFNVVLEKFGDLFEQPKDFSLAHCVAEDMRMGSGIAVSFKREFKNVPDLLDQRAKQGGLAVLNDEENHRFVYYLVTKRESTGKPTYETLWKSLYKMREHIISNEVKKLAVPRLGCGLDRLDWDQVKSMLEFLFRDLDLQLIVCNFQQEEPSFQKKIISTCRLVVETYPITEIARGTFILYFTTENGDRDKTMKELAKKFDILSGFSGAPKKSGDVIIHEDRKQNYVLAGCVVRKTQNDPLSFKSLQKCVQEINKTNLKTYKENPFMYVAIQWLNERDYFDDLITQKVITVLVNQLRNVEVYVCKGWFD